MFHTKPHTNNLLAFTLVELLVVIGIIALLISILLPALNRARDAANTIACQANLRSIGQATAIYLSENKGAIPGSAWTTGAHLWDFTGGNTFTLKTGISSTNSPGVVDIQDYIGPLARLMKLKLIDVEQGNVDVTESLDVRGRYRAYRNLAQFKCPTIQGAIQTEFTSTGTGTGQMLSYATTASFLMTSRRNITTNNGMSGSGWTPGSPYWVLPDNYGPKINRVGQTSEKIFMADSSRWTNGASAPSFSIGGIGGSSWHNTTPFADWGAFGGATKSYGRWNVPGLAGVTPTNFDARLLSFRHGSRKPGQGSGNVRLNALFFDGHVATLAEREAINPSLWLPRATRFNDTAANVTTNQPLIWSDARTSLGIPAGAWNVP